MRLLFDPYNNIVSCVLLLQLDGWILQAIVYFLHRGFIC